MKYFERLSNAIRAKKMTEGFTYEQATSYALGFVPAIADQVFDGKFSEESLLKLIERCEELKNNKDITIQQMFGK